jgi:hypothetical protein
MSNVVSPPTAAVLKASELIDEAILSFIKARSAILRRLGKWKLRSKQLTCLTPLGA